MRACSARISCAKTALNSIFIAAFIDFDLGFSYNVRVYWSYRPDQDKDVRNKKDWRCCRLFDTVLFVMCFPQKDSLKGEEDDA